MKTDDEEDDDDDEAEEEEVENVSWIVDAADDDIEDTTNSVSAISVFSLFLKSRKEKENLFSFLFFRLNKIERQTDSLTRNDEFGGKSFHVIVNVRAAKMIVEVVKEQLRQHWVCLFALWGGTLHIS